MTDDPRQSNLQRIAAALGWDSVPELDPEGREDLERRADAAWHEARLVYGDRVDQPVPRLRAAQRERLA